MERCVSDIDVVLVDEEAVGTLDSQGCGAKILLRRNTPADDQNLPKKKLDFSVSPTPLPLLSNSKLGAC